jgi:threonine aldolase
MYSFQSDYCETAHPAILKKLSDMAYEQNIGYGLDLHSAKAAAKIRQKIGREDADIHFLCGGTQTNMVAISSVLRPYECVIAADSGHINVHETGAIEASGHKVFTYPSVAGKLTVDGIEYAMSENVSEHMVKPGMVYISQSTEWGTVYTKKELTDLYQACQKHHLVLYIDGARLSSAMTSDACDLSFSDLPSLCDIFSIGGTKSGALYGEALVILKETFKKDFRYLIKNRSAMLAKGFIVGAEYEVLFENNLYEEIGRHENEMAQKIKDALLKKGYSFYQEPESNQLFPILTEEKVASLSKNYLFDITKKLKNHQVVVRFVTSWATSPKQVDALVSDL